MKMIVIVLLGFAICCAKDQDTLSYSLLQDAGLSCSPYDSCQEPRTVTMDNLVESRCECRESCSMYDTCCIDSPRRTTERIPLPKELNEPECQTIPHTLTSVYAVCHCSSKWTGDSKVKSACEQPPENLKDPMAVTPVTNMETSKTYQNYFCGLCNYEKKESLTYWEIRATGFTIRTVHSDEDLASFHKGLIYDKEKAIWGVNFNEKFRPINITFHMSEPLKNVVSSCNTALVSKCNSSWTDESTRKKCESYMAIVYLTPETGRKPVAYRNVHCAMCNFQKIPTSNVCASHKKSSLDIGQSHWLGILLNANSGGGNTVGKVEEDNKESEDNCSDDEVRDALYKDCRSLSCILPGQVEKDGECVSSSR